MSKINHEFTDINDAVNYALKMKEENKKLREFVTLLANQTEEMHSPPAWHYAKNIFKRAKECLEETK